MIKPLPGEDLLLKRFKNGVPGAFEQIYGAYVPDLLQFAAQRLSSLEEARDLIQDIFVDLYERKDTLEITNSLRAYLFSALKYKIIDHIRRNIHREFYTGIVSSIMVNTHEGFLDNFIYKDLYDLMEDEIQRLPTRMKEAFLLSRKNHLSISEIARQMDVSEQTVKNQIRSALIKLRPVLDKIILLFFSFAFISLC